MNAAVWCLACSFAREVGTLERADELAIGHEKYPGHVCTVKAL